MSTKHVIVIALSLIITALVFVRGILPGFTTIGTDFPNYYTSARLVMEGSAADSLYSTTWFQKQIERFGITQQGKFSPFPPPTALAYIPVAFFNPLNALRIVTAANILFLLLSILLLQKILKCDIWDAALVVLLAGSGLINCFRFGQMYIALSLSIIAGFYFFRTKRPMLAGICFGLFIPIKYFAAVVVLYFALKKQGRLVIASAITACTILGISIITLGWNIHTQFLFTEAPKHLASNLILQTPFSFTFQSWDSLFRTLFVFDSQFNPTPLFDSPPLYIGSKLVVSSFLVIFTSWMMYKGKQRHEDVSFEQLSVSIIIIAGILISPASATYHLLLLWLPAGLMLTLLHRFGRKREWFLFLGLYGIIGFIPYSIFSGFDGKGALTALAYPRLFLVSVLYVLTAKSIFSYIESIRTEANKADLEVFNKRELKP